MARPRSENVVSLLFVMFVILIDNTNGRRVRHEISTPSTTEARIVFPGRSSTKNEDKPRSPPLELSLNHSESNEIPVSLFLNSHLTSTEDFIKEFVINKDDFQSAFPASSYPGNASIYLRANSGVQTNEIAKMAFCIPQLTTVELEKSSDPAVIYFPSCTRIERCGGCCVLGLLSCEPTQTEIVHIKVMINRYKPGSDGFISEGFKHMELEKHTRCSCKCRVKADDCNALQDYRPNECKCVCRNQHEIPKCIGGSRFWDPNTCSCQCRNIIDCSTGFYYDMNTCTCQPIQMAAVPRLPSGLTFQWKNPQFSQSSQSPESTYQVHNWENKKRRSSFGTYT